MQTLPQTLLTLARQPASRDLSVLLPRFHQVIESLTQAERLFLLTLHSSRDDFLALDEEVMPNALFWSPVSDPEQATRFVLDDDQRWRLAGDAIRDALALTTLPPNALQESRNDATGGSQTLFERLADAISGNRHVAPGISLLWADSLIMEPTNIIVTLALEDDVYGVIVGENNAGEPVAIVIGTQPFEGVKEPESSGMAGSGDYTETVEDGGYVLEGSDKPQASWWTRLQEQHEHTLLRASWLQVLMEEPLSLAAPEQPPVWSGIPLLPLASPGGVS